MGLVKTYDASKVDVAFMGLPITGWGDNDFIEIARDEPLWTIQKGADGEVSRSKNVDDSATAKIVCHQTSQANKTLAGFAQLDRLTGKGIGPFLLTEGDSFASSIEAWVEELPAMTYGKEAGRREWLVRLAKAEIFIGGNRA